MTGNQYEINKNFLMFCRLYQKGLVMTNKIYKGGDTFVHRIYKINSPAITNP